MCHAPITNIINRNNTLAVSCENGAIQLWKANKTHDNWQLRWNTHPYNLDCDGTLVEGATGLSEDNRQVLEEHGAIRSGRTFTFFQPAAETASQSSNSAKSKQLRG